MSRKYFFCVKTLIVQHFCTIVASITIINSFNGIFLIVHNHLSHCFSSPITHSSFPQSKPIHLLFYSLVLLICSYFSLFLSFLSTLSPPEPPSYTHSVLKKYRDSSLMSFLHLSESSCFSTPSLLPFPFIFKYL